MQTMQLLHCKGSLDETNIIDQPVTPCDCVVCVIRTLITHEKSDHTHINKDLVILVTC